MQPWASSRPCRLLLLLAHWPSGLDGSWEGRQSRAGAHGFFVLSSPLGYSPFAGPSDASGPGLCSSKLELSSLRPLRSICRHAQLILAARLLPCSPLHPQQFSLTFLSGYLSVIFRCLVFWVLCLFKIYLLVLERERAWEGERIPRADSGLSTEPNTDLHLMTMWSQPKLKPRVRMLSRLCHPGTTSGP